MHLNRGQRITTTRSEQSEQSDLNGAAALTLLIASFSVQPGIEHSHTFPFYTTVPRRSHQRQSGRACNRDAQAKPRQRICKVLTATCQTRLDQTRLDHRTFTRSSNVSFHQSSSSALATHQPSAVSRQPSARATAAMPKITPRWVTYRRQPTNEIREDLQYSTVIDDRSRTARQGTYCHLLPSSTAMH